MVIDPFVEEELQASGIAQAWKTGLAHELAIKLALKFGDQFNTVDPVDDILRFLESPNGLAFFNKKAAQADTYWQDTWGKGEFDINVGNVVDFIQPDELKKLIYPGQERAQLKLSIPGEPSRENDQREMFEAEDELSDFIRQLRHNPEDVSRVLDEYLDYDEADQMWTLASYSDYTGGAVDRANANYFRNTYPGVVSRIFGTFNTQACGIKRKDLKNLDGTTLDQILGDLRSLENYPVLDEGYYAEAERDMQDEAWSSWIRRQFMRDMENKFPGYEAEFDSLNQEQERKFFEMIRDRTGIEWFESGSQMTVHVDQIVERATENMLDEFFHPELMEEAQAPKPLLLHYGVSSVEVAKCFETGLRKPFLRADAAQALQDARKTAEEIGGEPVVLDIIIRDLTRLRPDQYAMKTIQEGTTESWRVSLDLTGSVRYDGSLLPENLSVRPLLEAQFSCVMAPAPDDITQKVISWGQMFVTDDKLYIDPKKPDSFGREHEVHVTVKFGLHEKYPSEELLRIIEETQPFEIDIGRCSLFENEIFDVVKFDIQSEGIRALNARISELANSDEHPDYTPHMTVAYVKKGSCHDLIGKPLVDGENANGNRFIVKAVIFSPPNKDKRTLFLGKPNLQEAAVDKPVVNA